MSSELAPGLRELTRGESALPLAVPLAPHSDTCLRGVFAANGPVVAALVTNAGRLLYVSEAASPALLGDKGPVCVAKDEDVHVEVQGPAGDVRYVVWASR